MRALTFLFTRSLYNGAKRSLSSPRRLIGLIFLVGYYLWIFQPRFTRDFRAPGRETMPQVDFPPIAMIDSVVFAGFAIMTVLLSLGIFGYKGGFKQADVDVLFPTPISPKLLVVYRLVRDSLLTLVVPLLFILFARPLGDSWASMFRGLPNPESSAYVGRAAWASYLLMSMAFVSVGYAASIFFNRPEERYERARRWMGWGLFGVFLLVTAYVVLAIRASTGGEDLIRLAQNPALRAVFFLATGATALTMAPLEGSWLHAGIGAGLLLGTTIVAVYLALRQSGFVYEQAALRTADINNARSLQQAGDTYGLLAEHARSGKLKAGKKSWIHRLRPNGAMALVWKEYLLQARSGRAFYLLFPLMAIGLGILPPLAASDPTRGLGPGFLVLQLLIVFIATVSLSQGGFIEMLRRVDLQKPLPFTSATIVFFEVVAKAVLGMVCVLLGTLATFVVAPRLWPHLLAGIVGLPTVSLLLSAIFCLVIVLFPDVDDPTQRGFRGLVNMLGILLFCGPSIGVYILLVAVGMPPVLAALPVAAGNVALAVVAATIAGRLYSSFNPSE